MTKGSKSFNLEPFGLFNGRCERIRTFDPLHPMQVRYQAAPHTEQASNYSRTNWRFDFKLRSAVRVFQTTLHAGVPSQPRQLPEIQVAGYLQSLQEQSR